MRKKLISVALAGAFIFGACGGGGTSGDAGGSGDEAAATPEEVPSGDITFYGTEFAFEGPETIGAGETTFTLVNQGKQPHMLVMVELLEGKTIDDVNTFLEEEGADSKPPSWVKEIKVEAFAKPGKEGTAKPVDLAAGSYAILCFVGDKETHKAHAQLRMTKALTVE
jgi:hypothetical protein